MTSYATLLTLSIAHPYYRGNCRDFDLILPADGGRLLRDGRMTARTLDGSLVVFWGANGEGKPLAKVSGSCLRVGLRLANPQLANLTRFDYDPHTSFPLFRNNTDPQHLDLPIPVTPCGRLLSHTLQRSGRPLTVALRNLAQQTVAVQTLTDAAPTTSASFDLSGRPAGCYRVEEQDADGSRQCAYYLEPELFPRGLFAMVELTLAEEFYASPPRFTVQLPARQESLRYYVVVRNYSDKELAQLAVVDAGHEAGDPDLVSFERLDQPDANDDELAQHTYSLLGRDGARVVLFRSTQLLARRSDGLKKIQLTKNGDVLIRHLPQPGPDRVNGDVIIHISK